MHDSHDFFYQKVEQSCEIMQSIDKNRFRYTFSFKSHNKYMYDDHNILKRGKS